MYTSRRGRKARASELDKNFGLSADELERLMFRIPRFTDARPLDDNVHMIARPLWGKARAEWAMCLAYDLVAEVPDADGAARREWTAAILWAVAMDCRMDREVGLRAEVVDDITTATDVGEDIVRERFRQLGELGLTRPRNPPAWWD